MAEALSKLRPTQTATQLIGLVERSADGIHEISHAGGVLRSRCAASCLIAPNVGDTVLLVSDGSCAWILAVLERLDKSALRIESEHDIAIHSSAGKLSLQGAHGLSVRSDTALDLSADTLHLQAREGNVLVEQLSWLGKSALAHLGRIEWVGNLLEAVSERMRITTRHSLREVEELDQVRAGTMDQRVEGTCTIRAENTIVTARELVKLDGGQVHLG
ncbi:DUF3540 domain-containing protein [Viridibacterium curvum]|uniref:DUF3540 domain-containing protein n=1 Tax=Viridibacterium curvum TaxID=1101404 RepID=A0ABP9QPN5_9RHOO